MLIQTWELIMRVSSSAPYNDFVVTIAVCLFISSLLCLLFLHILICRGRKVSIIFFFSPIDITAVL